MVTSISEVLMFSQLSSQRQKGQMKPPRSGERMRLRTCSETRRAPVELVVRPMHAAQTSPARPSCGCPQSRHFIAGFIGVFFAGLRGAMGDGFYGFEGPLGNA